MQYQRCQPSRVGVAPLVIKGPGMGSLFACKLSCISYRPNSVARNLICHRRQARLDNILSILTMSRFIRLLLLLHCRHLASDRSIAFRAKPSGEFSSWSAFSLSQRRCNPNSLCSPRTWPCSGCGSSPSTCTFLLVFSALRMYVSKGSITNNFSCPR